MMFVVGITRHNLADETRPGLTTPSIFLHVFLTNMIAFEHSFLRRFVVMVSSGD